MDTEPSKVDGQATSESVEKEAEEMALCSNCHHANSPTAHFCEKCRMPLSSYSVIAPFERVFSYGWILRRASTGRPPKIVFLGMWLFCGGTALFSLIVLVGFACWTPAALWTRVFVSIPAAVILVACTLLLYKVTRNFLRGP